MTNNQPVESNTLPVEVARFVRLWLSLPHPFYTQTALLRMAGISSGSKQSSLKHALISHGLIREHKLQVGKSFTSVWGPTEKAHELTAASPMQHHSKGGYLHQFAAHHVKAWATANGYQSSTEFFLTNGKAVDLVLRKDAEIVFVEIGISEPFSKELSNIKKDTGSAIQPTAIWILVKDSKSRVKVQELLNESENVNSVTCPIEVKLIGSVISEI